MPQEAGIAHKLTLQNGATGTGNGTAVEVTRAPSGSHLGLTMQITGISGDTITWEGTVDGTNWIAVMVENLNTGTEATTATGNGLYRLAVLGLTKFRARVSTYGAGTIYVTGWLTA